MEYILVEEGAAVVEYKPVEQVVEMVQRQELMMEYMLGVAEEYTAVVALGVLAALA